MPVGIELGKKPEANIMATTRKTNNIWSCTSTTMSFIASKVDHKTWKENGGKQNHDNTNDTFGTEFGLTSISSRFKRKFLQSGETSGYTNSWNRYLF